MTQTVTQSAHPKSSGSESRPRSPGRYLQRRGRIFYFRKRLPFTPTATGISRSKKSFFCASLRTDLLSEAYQRTARLLQIYEERKRQLMLDIAPGKLPSADINSLLHAILRSELDRIITIQNAPLEDEKEIDTTIAALTGRSEKIRKDMRRNDFSEITPLVANAADTTGLCLPAYMSPDLGRRAASIIRELITIETNVLDGEDAKSLAAPLVAKVSARSVEEFVSSPIVTIAAASEHVGVLYPSNDMRKNNSALTKVALMFFDDAPVSTLTQDRQKEFFHWLGQLPKYHGRKANKKTTFHGNAFQRALKDEEIHVADTTDAKIKSEIDAINSISLAEKRARLSQRLTPRLTLNTLRRYRDSLNRLFRAATDLGNPDTPSAISYRDIERIINAVKPEDPLDLRVTKSKTRDSWTEERLAKFLTCPIFKGCFSKHRRWRPGNIIIRDAFYWVPLIVLTIGSRIKEILLLKRDNLRLRNGVFCLAVGLDADQSNKTESARRYVPIPQLLLDLGFVEWIRSLPEDHGTLLFPDAVDRAATIDVVSPFSKALNRGLASMGLGDFDEDFYALRKTFHSMLSDCDVSDGERQAIAGHSRQSVINRHYTAFRSKKLKKAVDAADFAVSIDQHPKYKFPVITSCNLANRETFSIEATLADDNAIAELQVSLPDTGEVIFNFSRIDPATGVAKPNQLIVAAAKKFDALVHAGTMKLPKEAQKQGAIEAFHALA
ncbi:site-specific integrase [Yoonia maritima]|uniref:site-specific integrase n=1 Tax=Yoonia maritima TaxID=1435347 RepID=UPI003735BE0F